jgi:hypothetical protein
MPGEPAVTIAKARPLIIVIINDSTFGPRYLSGAFLSNVFASVSLLSFSQSYRTT